MNTGRCFGEGELPITLGQTVTQNCPVHWDVDSHTLRDLKNKNNAILLFPLPGMIFARLAPSYPFVLAWIPQSQSHPRWTDMYPPCSFLPLLLPSLSLPLFIIILSLVGPFVFFYLLHSVHKLDKGRPYSLFHQYLLYNQHTIHAPYIFDQQIS